jgi:cellulose synthase/poly-beta-1,6-N-acetylglucosamine synthase-like glycosyltransferase
MSSLSLPALLSAAILMGLAIPYAIGLVRFATAITRLSGSSPAPPHRGDGTDPDLPFVTVVVAARNEAANLGRSIPRLLDQDYPSDRYEVVVVDDRSSDETSAVVERHASDRAGQLRLVRVESLPEGWTGKKWAVHRGIAAAKGEIILTTDADCLAGQRWIGGIVAHFMEDPGCGLVGAPVDYEGAADWNWPDRLLRTEFVALSLVAAGSIAIRRPLVISAQNMAYRRSLYDAIGGQEPHSSIPTGDDVFLLFSAHASGAGISYSLHPDTVVRTQPPSGPRAFYHQRARWASKGPAYPAGPRTFSTIVWGLNALLLAGLPLALAGTIPGLGPWLAAAWGLKGAGDVALLSRGNLLGLRGSLFDYLTGIPLHIPYVVFFGLAGRLGAYRWR